MRVQMLLLAAAVTPNGSDAVGSGFHDFFLPVSASIAAFDKDLCGHNDKENHLTTIDEKSCSRTFMVVILCTYKREGAERAIKAPSITTCSSRKDCQRSLRKM